MMDLKLIIDTAQEVFNWASEVTMQMYEVLLREFLWYRTFEIINLTAIALMIVGAFGAFVALLYLFIEGNHIDKKLSRNILIFFAVGILIMLTSNIAQLWLAPNFALLKELM